MERVTHDGRATAYEWFDRGGSKPGVLFVHGSGGNRGVWKSQARLADERPVVRMDLSGHGDSEDCTFDGEPAGEAVLRAYAADVAAVTRATGIDRLVGSSLGGAVALWLAAHGSVEPTRLVIAGAGAQLRVSPTLLEWLSSAFDRAVSFLHGDDRLFHDPSAAVASHSRAAMRETGQAVTRRDFRASDAFDVRESLATLDQPTLAVVGEHDELTPVSLHESLAAGLPDCELAVIEDAAHLAMLERPVAFNSAVSSFLDRR